MRLSDKHRLHPDKLRWTCDPTKLGMRNTAQLKDLTSAIGQDRALGAVRFGVEIPSDGYNIFVLGPVGTGRSSMARAILEEVAASQPSAGDWCYVHNFKTPNEPKAVALPPGVGAALVDDATELIEDIQHELAAAFDSEVYAEQREEAVRQFREERTSELQGFEREAEAAGMAVGRGPAGLIVAPAKDGEVMSPQEYGELSEKQRATLDRKREELQEKLNELLRRGHRKERWARADLKRLDEQFAQLAVSGLFEDMRRKYRKHKAVVQQLTEIEADVVAHVESLRARDDDPPPFPFAVAGAMENRYDLYRVNLLLTQGPNGGAPVVYEPNPTIDNLTGQVEHRTQMGALVTDHTMIRPGALHRANGGYLILEAETVLRRPYAWETLKRALRHKSVRIESLQDQLRFLSTVTLEPEPIPLDVKVVLVGTPYIYYLLSAHDDDFAKLFKVKADFDTSTKRTAASLKLYARFVATRCREEKLPHFDARAVARVLEHAARLSADQTRLTTRFQDIADLVREAAHWSGNNRRKTVKPEHVERALQESIHRSNRIEERLQELVDRGIIMLELDGEAVGEINALSVIPLGDYWFGRPTRITARTFVGRSGVTQIDREAKLTGRIHDKGVLILSGFMADRFGRDHSLALAASITFEQMYDTIDGDSASSAELYALMSSLGDAPIKQGIAVTGAVNQLGEVQAIGGVNEKIEGFFAACKSRGLTGDQGVIIPKANVQNLMLDREVVAAVAAGRFSIYAVSNVDQGLEILTGLPVGRRDANGEYPEASLNGRVADTLIRFADAYDGNGSHGKDDDGEDGGAETDQDKGDGSDARRARSRSRRSSRA